MCLDVFPLHTLVNLLKLFLAHHNISKSKFDAASCIYDELFIYTQKHGCKDIRGVHN